MATTFTVQHRGIRIKVKLLPTVDDVHRAYTGGSKVPRRGNANVVHGFFEASCGDKYVGTIVMPMQGSNLLEIVPHETAHAVIHHLNGVLSHDDEPCSTAIGCISARIFAQLRKIGVSV
ncbi:MAG: hypothetical protein AB1722_12405 [Pseudomonadota bacterium]